MPQEPRPTKMSPIDRLEWLAAHVSPSVTVHGSSLADVLRDTLTQLPTCPTCGLTADVQPCPRCAGRLAVEKIIAALESEYDAFERRLVEAVARKDYQAAGRSETQKQALSFVVLTARTIAASMGPSPPYRGSRQPHSGGAGETDGDDPVTV